LGLILFLVSIPAGAGEKHALLVIGELSLPLAKQQVAQQLLASQGHIVHKLLPSSSAQVTAEITRLGAISADPNTPAWDLFAFYFIGHGGSGFMQLNDADDDVTGFLDTQAIAQQAFEEIWVDSWTFAFDMCNAADAVPFVRTGMEAAKDDPSDPDMVGWVMVSSGFSSGGLSYTYGTLYTQAVSDCLGRLTPPPAGQSALENCIKQERFDKPWWYKSYTDISEVSLGQPASVPLF
jgi:hypothetical protein